MAYQSTPFTNFAHQVDDLNRSPLARNLNNLNQADASGEAISLDNALGQLRNTVERIKALHGPNGPRDNWNAPNSGWGWNGGLSPSLGPQTPPRTPVFGQGPQDFARLESEIRDLNKRLDRRRQEIEDAGNKFLESERRLAKANKKIQEYQKELSDANNKALEHQRETFAANSSIEGLRDRLADEYIKSKQFDKAAHQYDRLSELKAKENSRKRKLDDVAGAMLAERDQLSWMSKCSEMLVKAGEYAHAEDSIRYVWQRRKEILNDYDIKQQETRDAQAQLCKVLRLQQKEDKLNEAEYLYRGAANLSSIHANQSEANRTWSIQNAFNLACVYAECQWHSEAESLFKRVWASRAFASAKYLKTLDSEIPQLVTMLEERGNAEAAANILETMCKGNVTLPAPVWQHLKTQGMLFHAQGKHVRAAGNLMRVWHDPSTDQPTQPQLGWALAYSICSQGIPSAVLLAEAKSILQLLLLHHHQPSSPPAHSTTAPSRDELQTLLAHVHLALTDLPAAATAATPVYANHGAHPILPANPAFNHANTLIRALCTQSSLSKDAWAEKCNAAHEVWQTVYADCVAQGVAGKGRELLLLHAAAGTELATQWKEVSRRRGREPRKAREVLVQAKAVRRLAGGEEGVGVGV